MYQVVEPVTFLSVLKHFNVLNRKAELIEFRTFYLGVWKTDKTLSLVFNILLQSEYYFYSCCSLFAVDISLQNATIFVNFPFLLPLLEFFTAQPSDLHNQQQHHVTTASQTSLDTAPVRVSDPAIGDEDGTLHRLESKIIAATRTFSQVDAAPLPAQGSQMKISVHGVVKEPDIVLLSDATRRDSEALIVQVS